MKKRAWTGRVALVTGASSGIGEAVATTLVNMGMRVVLSARRKDRLQALAERIGGDTMVVPADLRDDENILSLFSRIRDRWGGVDVLVNNAGLGRVAPLSSGDTESWREMLEVNVLALAICTREALRDLQARDDDGQIIHISSMSAHRVPTGTGGMYSASKHAVKAMTEALRRELRARDSRTRVTAVSPGFVETEFAETMLGDADAARRVYARFPCLQPEDVANSVQYILEQPEHVQIHDILLRPAQQDS